MKHVSIVVPRGQVSLVNVAGTHQILNWVNMVAGQHGGQPIFEVDLVGLDKDIQRHDGLFTTHVDKLIDDVKKTDIIILPAVHGDQKQVIEMNQDLTPWLVKQYQQGAEIVGLCIATFYIASTGLLDGKKCSTHWVEANAFRQMFPHIELLDDRIVTEQDGIYTSGGAYSALNLIMRIVEKYAGRDVAVMGAKAFQVDPDRVSQSPFAVFTGQKDHDDAEVIKAQNYIETHYKEKISVEDLATMFALGRRNLERRFKKATANTVLEYIQRVKIEAAKKSLESSNKNVSEVMYDIGYSDSKAFRNVFKKFTGLSPVEYRNKYNKGIAIAREAQAA